MWKGEDWLGMGLDGLCSVWVSAGTRVLCRPKRETCDRGCSLESTGRPFYLRRAIERETGSRAFQQRTKIYACEVRARFLSRAGSRVFLFLLFFFFSYFTLSSPIFYLSLFASVCVFCLDEFVFDATVLVVIQQQFTLRRNDLSLMNLLVCMSCFV